MTSTPACTENIPKDTTDTSFKQPEITSDASRSCTVASTQLNTNAHSSAVSSSTSIGSSADSNKTHNVRLPAFTGKSNEWKVWYSRFHAVAEINHWTERTRLSELLQRLQGVAAEFVFDEISPDCRSNYNNLVRELDLRFKCVETNKSYSALFSKRTQHFGESVENYASELKRLYDKAYPGKNPEMRRTLLLQQLNCLWADLETSALSVRSNISKSPVLLRTQSIMSSCIWKLTRPSTLEFVHLTSQITKL